MDTIYFKEHERCRHFHKWHVAKIRGQHRATSKLQGYLNFAFHQRDVKVNLHKATSSPSDVSPTSGPSLKPTLMVKISTNQIAKNRHT